jgi:hypothetical protein
VRQLVFLHVRGHCDHCQLPQLIRVEQLVVLAVLLKKAHRILGESSGHELKKAMHEQWECDHEELVLFAEEV